MFQIATAMAAIALSALGLLPAHAQPARIEPVRLATSAFGTSAEIEIRGRSREVAEAAARRALQVIFEIGQLADSTLVIPGGVAEINANAGQGPKSVSEQTSELLLRSLQVCFWSNGAHGPLGGELRRIWNDPAKRFPNTEDVRLAVASADCSLLGLSGGEPPKADLSADSRIDTSWLARGFAIDRAVERLQEDGIDNAWIEIGPVRRALGGGPGGLGWSLRLPPAPDSTEPVDELLLMDQAVAIVTRTDDRAERILDQRTGVPPRGVVMVTVVAQQAWDAEALAASLYVLGLREGQLRLGGYSPRPSILWLLGEGEGTPLQSTYRWSELRRMPSR